MHVKIERSTQEKFPEQTQTTAMDLAQYRQYLQEQFYLEPDEIEKGVEEYARLLKELSFIQEEVLFISIGCSNSSMPEQQFPTYLKNIAKTEKVRVILIDGLFRESKRTERLERELVKNNSEVSSYEHKEHPNLAVGVFGCYLPEDCFLPVKGMFKALLKEAICQVLDKGGKVFIANHTQAYSFKDIPDVADVCNLIKTSHPLGGTHLQFYTQGGFAKVRYYLDKTCDCARDAYNSGNKFEPEHDEFYVCSTLQDLANVEQFQPRFQELKKEIPPGHVEEEQRVKHLEEQERLQKQIEEEQRVKQLEEQKRLQEQREEEQRVKHIEEQSSELVEEQHPRSFEELQPGHANFSMMILGGFIAAVGIAAVAIAFTVLNAATFGIAGLVVAGVGIVATLSGIGLFATGAYKNRQATSEDTLNENLAANP